MLCMAERNYRTVKKGWTSKKNGTGAVGYPYERPIKLELLLTAHVKVNSR